MTKFQYQSDHGYTIDPFANVNYYSLGTLDNYQFKRKQSTKQSKLIAEIMLKVRIENLRKKYSYIRLWYSGGKDSTLVLQTAIKNNVVIDEIVMIKRVCKQGPNLYPEFSQENEINSAIEYLESLKSQIPNTLITVVEVDSEHHEAVFENLDWYRHTTEWYINIGYTMNLFYRYVNPKFQILKDIPNRCDLCGAAVPDVWFDKNDNKWKFNFIDAIFVTAHGGEARNTVFEDFLITEDDPALLEFFVNTIVDDIKDEFQQNGSLGVESSHGDRQRKTRDRSSIYSTLENYNIFQFKKSFDPNFKLPNKHPMWAHDFQPKAVYDIINRYYQTPIPRCLDLYMNQSPWDLIEKQSKNRIYTKTWTLE